MKVIRKDEIEVKTNPRGINARRLVNRDAVGVMNLILDPGDEVPEHSVPVDVFFYVVGGEGDITIGGATARVKAGDIVICPKETTMALKATDEKFEVLNVKTPNLKS